MKKNEIKEMSGYGCARPKKIEKLSEFQKKLANRLLKHLKEHPNTIIRYGEISLDFYKHKRGSRAFRIPAGYVSSYCMQNSFPPLTAIMCNGTGLPGGGFDDMYNALQKDKKLQISDENRRQRIAELQNEVFNQKNWLSFD